MKTEKLLEFDQKLRKQYGPCLVGIDEAGRGAGASVIVAAAVCLPPNTIIEGLNDSKQLTPEKRIELDKQIRNKALAFDIQEISAEQIDTKGIQWANKHVMLRAAHAVQDKLNREVDLYIVDESPCTRLDPMVKFPKADGKSLSVAAASVLAKVYRDALMDELAKIYPNYHLDISKGYLTPEHKEAIQKFGLIKGLHRFSYNIKD